ncbi:MAG: hypothetical protein GX443_04850 [Deltaproteobacteria bacterium]|nr:hypothetical protein [Deltaproteobacteria bacterium]
MTEKKHSHQKGKSGQAGTKDSHGISFPPESPANKLEIVLKTDSIGTQEAIAATLAKTEAPGVRIKIIHAGVGDVSKSDLLMALTGSRLVVGFNVGAMPRLDQWAKEHGVEVRIHKVIYALAQDVLNIARSLTPSGTEEPDEKITGKAEVIALFKTGHGGIIAGCRVQEGTLAVGKRFRVISTMGPVYSGKIDSLQVGRQPVHSGKPAQEVGLKISDFNRVSVGDLIECFEPVPIKKTTPWHPSGSILQLGS